MSKHFNKLKRMKVSIFDKQIRVKFLRSISVISTFLYFILIFYSVPENFKTIGLIMTILLFLLYYLSIWYKANSTNSINLRIQGSIINIKIGDIFKQDNFKVIPFNEYFDTNVDDKLINKTSLNGIYIEKHFKNSNDLRQIIDLDEDLNVNKYIVSKNTNRKGNTTKYKLGSCIVIKNEYILTAFSKFDDENKANLTMNEYLEFLNNFWNEINRLYAQKSVTVPVFGSGITRFKNGFEDININELISIMIWTFKISRIKFAYPAYLTIIIPEEKFSEVNLYKIKSEEEH